MRSDQIIDRSFFETSFGSDEVVKFTNKKNEDVFIPDANIGLIGHD